jgi:asparagine synthase (glutamine-hydrolysing)
MVSDVPVGVFLSGGIDSTLLTAILQKHCGNIHTFTVGFEEGGFDESANARLTAKLLGTTHFEKMLTLDEAGAFFDRFYDIYDEPFADTSGIPVAFVTQLAKDNGMKVVLSADGGDEFFGGYSHYLTAARLNSKLRRLPQGVRKAIATSSRAIVGSQLRKRIRSHNFEHRLYALEELLLASQPEDFFEAFVANQSNPELALLLNHVPSQKLSSRKSLDLTSGMMQWDSDHYLPDDLLVKVDRATMHYSIESREPFLDHRIVEFAQRLPNHLKIQNGESKYILRRILSRYISPHHLSKQKKGFSIPIFSWFNRSLDRQFEQLLTRDQIERINVLNWTEVEAEHMKYKYYRSRGRAYNVEKMWRILSFVLWWNKYADRG